MLNFHFHLAELKFRFFYGFFSFFLTVVVSYFYAETLTYFYTLPFLKFQLLSNKIVLTNFIFTNLSEAFYSYIYVAVFTSFYFSIFVFIQSFFSYIKTGLFSYEKELLYKFITIFVIYINLIIFLFIQYFLPFFLSFFLSFEKLHSEKLFTIRYEAKLLDYLLLNTQFIGFSFILFLVPIILFFLFELNLFSCSFLRSNRRLFIFCFFLLGGIFSPPDIYSQLIIALPLSFCFELIIFLAYLKNLYIVRYDKKLFKKH